ncbi:MAG TPA: hypothetical protein VMA32_16000 [Streptosporangiaceae bacterium]|nr:hypothetical protein [Streptosporangiaceae bacterium]
MDSRHAAALPSQPVRGCTLATADQMTRGAEFGQLFADMVLRTEQPAPTRLRLELRRDPAAARRAAELAVAETECCSFFTFTLTAAADRLMLEIAVPDAHQPALAALAGRAAGQVPA